MLSDGVVAGSSSYLDIAPADGRIEIGSTWYGDPWRGTCLNPSAKLLLLEHAFDVLGATRVQLKTDARNERSRRAIAGIGASFEGILRKHSLRADGPGLRDVAMFSITDEDWPGVRALLEARISTRPRARARRAARSARSPHPRAARARRRPARARGSSIGSSTPLAMPESASTIARPQNGT